MLRNVKKLLHSGVFKQPATWSEQDFSQWQEDMVFAIMLEGMPKFNVYFQTVFELTQKLGRDGLDENKINEIQDFELKPNTHVYQYEMLLSRVLAGKEPNQMESERKTEEEEKLRVNGPIYEIVWNRMIDQSFTWKKTEEADTKSKKRRRGRWRRRSKKQSEEQD